MSATLAQKKTTFCIRSCPACESRHAQPLFNLKPHDFCSVNPTYNNGFLDTLEIDESHLFPIDRCSNCGFVYARLLPSEMFLRRVYDEVIVYADCLNYSENNASYSRRLRYIATLLDLSAESWPLKALDFGFGVGVTLRVLEGLGINAVGYDSSAARMKGIKDCDSIVVDSLAQVEAMKPFDLLICDNVIEHVPYPRETIKFLSSISKLGTVVFVSVPSYEPARITEQLTALTNGQEIDMTLNPWEHLNYFSLKHLDQMFSSNGFVPIETTEMPGHVNVGLRAETQAFNRLKNSAASATRLITYALSGQSLRSTESAFYRFAG